MAGLQGTLPQRPWDDSSVLLQVGLDWGWVSVLPEAGLQRAADVLLEVAVHSSQTLQGRADF